MTAAAVMAPKVQVNLEADKYESLGVIPWFSYMVNFPERPLPPITQRPELATERLVIRPIVPTDLEAFHQLRSIPETQTHSTSRGRPDRDLEETKGNIERLQAPFDQQHWYWGAFLATTGELIGEGGLPDTEDQPTSGWARCEILIKPKYWRRGYGTEFFNAVMNSWWALPRKKRRHQLLPLVAGDADPGEEVTDGVEMYWEDSNEAATHFFHNVLGRSSVSHEGFFESFDWREGREGNLVRWGGIIVTNPRSTF